MRRIPIIRIPRRPAGDYFLPDSATISKEKENNTSSLYRETLLVSRAVKTEKRNMAPRGAFSILSAEP